MSRGGEGESQAQGYGGPRRGRAHREKMFGFNTEKTVGFSSAISASLVSVASGRETPGFLG
jgi:hypothetical protein